MLHVGEQAAGYARAAIILITYSPPCFGLSIANRIGDRYMRCQ